MSGGTGTIDGWVYLNGAVRPGACVTLVGPVSGTALTDASGKYVFRNLPPGDYTVCELQPEVVAGTWRQTYPWTGWSCSPGLGYAYALGAGSWFGFSSFMFVTP